MSGSSKTNKTQGFSISQQDIYLKHAEMEMEGNYNQLDGIINNQKPRGLTGGQTYDDIRELALETLPEERRSVLEQLERARGQAESSEQEERRRKMDR